MSARVRYSRTGNVFQAHDGKELVGSLTVDMPEASTDYASDYGQGMGDHGHRGGTGSLKPDWAERPGHPQEGQGILFDHQANPPVIDIAVTHRDYRRHGIATNLHYLASAQFGQSVQHSDNITPEAHAWGTSLGHDMATEAPTSGSWEDTIRPGDFASPRLPKTDLGGATLLSRRERAMRAEREQPVQGSLF